MPSCSISKIRKKLVDSAKTPEYQCELFLFDTVEILYDLMQKQHVTEQNLADRIGVDIKKIQNLLHGDSRVSIDLLSKSFWALGYRIILDIQEIINAPYSVDHTKVKGQLNLKF
jgi:hypothetical protein